ncbi:MAG TPA: phosphate ABC transporter permease PstA [Thermoanaerobaculia bacterium]|nr:phosphate ABC transporter permease PstA [Thermoanaerobaculia bacterium]
MPAMAYPEGLSAPLKSRRRELTDFFFRKGEPMIWLAGAGLAVSLILVIGLLVLVAARGLGSFWPRPLTLIETKDGNRWLGEVLTREPIPDRRDGATRIRVKIGNRDLYGLDFKWIDEPDVVKSETPSHALLLERQEYGNFHGFLREIRVGDQVVASGDAAGLARLRRFQSEIRPRFDANREAEKKDVGAINADLEKQRLVLRRAELSQAPDLARVRQTSESRISELERLYEALRERLENERKDLSSATAVLVDAQGKAKTMPVRDIVRIVSPNDLSFFGKIRVYGSRFAEFVSDEPRESNTEGGVFPAIFGTVLMVVLMSAVSVPLGVVAALYLREYAKQGRLVRIVRIAVNNLAGVPSIVFGIFGLGFFVYGIGGRIDRLFFREALPTPTYGTGGILWCAMTLAILTVPVVVVATEEALAAVPAGMRHASLALGATKWQTTSRIVLPAAAPGILTGLILAMARGTGEVAPLMIVGVVKLAPNLPVDGVFPYLHLERKIMHLGFHLYDVGFQSPNVEAAIPMVYTTTILLLLIVVALNLTAILVRNALRRKLHSAAF